MVVMLDAQAWEDKRVRWPQPHWPTRTLGAPFHRDSNTNFGIREHYPPLYKHCSLPRKRDTDANLLCHRRHVALACSLAFQDKLGKVGQPPTERPIPTSRAHTNDVQYAAPSPAHLHCKEIHDKYCKRVPDRRPSNCPSYFLLY